VISLELMPPLMFGGLVVFLLIGFPVAFSLCAVGLFFGFLSIELGFFTTAYLGNLPLRVFGILSNDLLLSIPFFTLMGAILERCGLAEDLLEGTGQLFGKVPGGLAYAVIIVGAILGAITGTVAASVITMGMILHDWNLEKKKLLIRKAYDALPKGGAFIAVENIIDDARRENAFGLMMSLNMLIEFGDAFDFTGADFTSWCVEAGFERCEIVHLNGPASAAIAYK